MNPGKEIARYAVDVTELRILLGHVHRKLIELCHELTAALPEELREKFGTYKSVSNLVYGGRCSFVIFSNVGSDLKRWKLNKLRREAIEKVRMVVEAWEKFGVCLQGASFSPANGGVIEVRFTM